MSQYTSVLTGGGGGDSWATAYPKINSFMNAMYSWESGASAPTPTPPTYLRWVDTSGGTKPLKINTGTPAVPVWTTLFPDVSVTNGGLLSLAGGTMTANLNMNSHKVTNVTNASASGDAVNKGQVDGKNLVAMSHVVGFNATLNRPLFVACGNLTIVKVRLLSDTATAGSGAGNRYDFQVRNVGTGGAGTTDLLSAVKTTNGAEITAYAPYDLGANQNLTMLDGEALQLRITMTGAPTNLSAAQILAQIVYKVSV